MRQLHHPRLGRSAADGRLKDQLLRRHGEPLPQHVLGGGRLDPRRERTARSAHGGRTDLHQRRLRGIRGAAAGHRGPGRALDRRGNHRLEPNPRQRRALQFRRRHARGRSPGRRGSGCRCRHGGRVGGIANSERDDRCPTGAFPAVGGLRCLRARPRPRAGQGIADPPTLDHRHRCRGQPVRHAIAALRRARRHLHERPGRCGRSLPGPALRRRLYHGERVGAHRAGGEGPGLRRPSGRSVGLRQRVRDDARWRDRHMERQRQRKRLGPEVLPFPGDRLPRQRRQGT